MPYEKAIELLLEIILEAMKSQPIEVRQELWRMHLADLEKWRAFFERLTPNK